MDAPLWKLLATAAIPGAEKPSAEAVRAAALTVAIEMDVALCALDVLGTGDSDDAYSGFGELERYDVAAVCQYIRAHRTPAKLALWGGHAQGRNSGGSRSLHLF